MLKNMLVGNPEKMYISDHFLNRDKLRLISKVFQEETTLEQKYFDTESGFVLLAVADGFLTQINKNEQSMQRLKQLFVRSLKRDSSFFGLQDL